MQSSEHSSLSHSPSSQTCTIIFIIIQLLGAIQVLRNASGMGCVCVTQRYVALQGGGGRGVCWYQRYVTPAFILPDNAILLCRFAFYSYYINYGN